MPRVGRVGGNPCRARDCAVPTAGPWVPASNPAASPSSRRSKLKGRFMLSDPWGGGRLSAGIEAWHGSALLRSRCLSGCPAPSCAPAPVPLVPRLCWGSREQAGLAGAGGNLAAFLCVPTAGRCHPLHATGQGLGMGWALPASACTDHKSCGSCRGEAAPAPLRQNGLRQEWGASPGTPRALTPSSLWGQGRGGWLGVPQGHRSCAACMSPCPHLLPAQGFSRCRFSRRYHQARGSGAGPGNMVNASTGLQSPLCPGPGGGGTARSVGAVTVLAGCSTGTPGCCWRLSCGAGRCWSCGVGVGWAGAGGHRRVPGGQGAGAVRGRSPVACAVT